MPGDNCSGFWLWHVPDDERKLPSAQNAEYKKWREEWLSEITKTRVIDKDFQKQIDSDKVLTYCISQTAPERINPTLPMHRFKCAEL